MTNPNKDFDIAVIHLSGKDDNSPVHMVSEKWLKHQRKLRAAVQTFQKRWNAMAAAHEQLVRLTREEPPE